MIDEDPPMARSLAEAQARIAALAAELVTARREFQHRVRNMLATVRSIARRSAAREESAQDYQMHLDGRLAALGRAHSVLLQEGGGGADLEALIAAEIAAFGRVRDGRIRVEGPPVRLKPDPAELIALAIHELATNAVKFGALGSPRGRIAIGWTIEVDDASASLCLDWRESGITLMSPPDRHRGFSTELLQDALAYELAASTSIDLLADGLSCRIRLPLACTLAA